MSADEPEHRLSPAPEAVLDILRKAEAQLDQIDSLRADFRRLREALEEAPPPTLEEVARRIYRSVALSDEGKSSESMSVTKSPATAGAELAVEVTIVADAYVTPPPEVKGWLDWVRKYGPAGYKVADLILRGLLDLPWRPTSPRLSPLSP